MKAINPLTCLVLIAVSTLMYSCKKDVSLEKNMEEHFYLENRNANMPVWVKGNGLSNVFVLTVHGGPILGSGADFDNASFANEMEDKYAMVYWDQRHSSNSHGHLKKEDMTIEAMISDINALVQVLKKRYGDEISLFIMGHSWGGTLSTAYLSTNGNQNDIKGWMNISGTPDALQEKKEGPKLITSLAEQEISLGNNVTEWQEIIDVLATVDVNNIDDAAEKIIDTEGGKMLELFRDDINPEQHRYGKAKYIFGPDDPLLLIINTFQTPGSFLHEVQTINLMDDLHKITIPTLIQFGKYDFGSSPELGQLLYDNISSTDKYFNVYKHSEHFAFTQEPEVFTQDVVNFVEAYK